MYVEKRKTGYKFVQTYTDEHTGKLRRVSVTLPKSTGQYRRDAQEILAAKIRKANSIVAPDMTIRRAADLYLAANRAEWRPATYRRNKATLGTLIAVLGEDTLVNKLSARYVIDRFAETGLRAGTLNEMRARLRAFLNWSYEHDIAADVKWFQKVKRYPEPTSRVKNAGKYLEKDELLALLPELKIDLNRYLVQFLALSGLRIGEALALQREDVDLGARAIHVTKTMDHATKRPLDGAKTDTSNRDVYIQAELFELCKEIRAYMAEMALCNGFRTEYFFSDFDGEPLQYARVNKYFRENTERVIGRPLTLHSLRHTHASLMFEAGATLEAVSLRLGHTDSKVTRDIYLHITERLKEKYNEQFEGVRLLE